MDVLQSLSLIFQNKIFRIPDYQRGYAWQDSQLRDFWEDVVNLQLDRYHYTGLLSLKVLSKAECQKLGNDDAWLLQSGYKAYHIVDGQQRLTTFVIMLNEIIVFVSKLPDNDGKPDEDIYLGFENIKDIRAKYICKKRPPDGLIVTYMFGYENDNPSAEYLKYHILGDYVNSLNETAEYWYYTYYPERYKSISDEEQVWLDKLNRIGLGYFRPLTAVSLIPRLGYTKEDRLAFFKAVERFIFINFRMAMYQSSYKSSDYYRKTREVYTSIKKLSEVTNDLNSTTDGNSKDAIRVFLTRMNRRFISAEGFYSWRDLRYFLYEYEYTLATKYQLEKLSWAVLTKVVKDRITVEHILPQKPDKLYWRNNFRQFNQNEIKLLSSSLGNLLPLSQSINSKLQNDGFDDKKARGYANGCHCEVEISKEQAWDARHIYDRGIKLLEFMETRWGFQFESIDQMDELLHIAFIKDGRDVPPEITE